MGGDCEIRASKKERDNAMSVSKYTRVGAIAFLTTSTALPTNAQSLMEQCMLAIQSADKTSAVQYAERLLKFRDISSPSARDQVQECLNFAFDEVYEYNGQLGRFMTFTENEVIRENHENKIAEADANNQRIADLAAEIERRETEKRRQVVGATIGACNELYKDDPVNALTNQICNPIFLQHGLPEN